MLTAKVCANIVAKGQLWGTWWWHDSNVLLKVEKAPIILLKSFQVAKFNLKWISNSCSLFPHYSLAPVKISSPSLSSTSHVYETFSAKFNFHELWTRRSRHFLVATILCSNASVMRSLLKLLWLDFWEVHNPGNLSKLFLA